MGGYSQVRKYSVQSFRSMQKDVIVYKSEIVVYQRETLVFQGVARGVGIPVESQEPAFRAEACKDCSTVAASAESGVGVAARRVVYQC